MQGEWAGGTIGADWLLVAARAELGPEAIRDLSLLVLHHELSSIVLRVDPLTWSKWKKFAPPSWDYAEEPGSALRGAHKPKPSLDTGFLNAYGATNLENDFNIYAEEMFWNPGGLTALAKEHPLIRRKLEFVMDTYIAIDPSFKEIFRKSGLPDHGE